MSLKQQARSIVSQTLTSLRITKHGEVCVRINAVSSGLAQLDLDAILSAPSLQAIVIPKVESPEDIHFVARAIETQAKNKNIRILASIESARGLFNSTEIIKSDPRVDALIFAAEDYCADLGIVRTSSRLELLYARQKIVATAVANNVHVFDFDLTAGHRSCLCRLH
jgi:citrate lyase subunit beta-like protein